MTCNCKTTAHEPGCHELSPPPGYKFAQMMATPLKPSVTTREEWTEAAERLTIEAAHPWDGKASIFTPLDHATMQSDLRLAALACRAQAKAPVAWRCEIDPKHVRADNPVGKCNRHMGHAAREDGGGEVRCPGRLRALCLWVEETGT